MRDDAIAALQAGDPILIYDDEDREGEVDLVYAAQHITPDAIARLRNDAGGLICCALSHDVCEQLGLPFYRDTIDHDAAETEKKGYGDHSSFSLWVNHDDTFTGITDNDRATTITALAEAAQTAENGGTYAFGEEFTTPGHVAVLRGAENGIMDRQGHTELSLALVQEAGLAPASVVCEMLDDDTGEALSVADARAYADEHGFVMIAGKEVIADLPDQRA